MRDNINAAIKSGNMTDIIIPTEIYVSLEISKLENDTALQSFFSFFYSLARTPTLVK